MSMKIIINWNAKYQDISIQHGGTTIDLGLHDKRERKELAQIFLDAVEELLNGMEDEATEIFSGTMDALQEIRLKIL